MRCALCSKMASARAAARRLPAGSRAEGRLKALLLKVISSSQPTDSLTDHTRRSTPCGPQLPFISGNFNPTLDGGDTTRSRRSSLPHSTALRFIRHPFSNHPDVGLLNLTVNGVATTVDDTAFASAPRSFMLASDLSGQTVFWDR
jgi:hypothetical protein